jgi:pre-rRNA-processing protein TSR2
MLLEDAMETQFNTICEDGSTEEIGELIVLMWNQCSEGDFTLATNALAREYSRHEVLAQSQGIDNGDAMDSDDENINDDNAAIMAMSEDAEIAPTLVSEEPMVDEDGFQMVSKKKGRKPR